MQTHENGKIFTRKTFYTCKNIQNKTKQKEPTTSYKWKTINFVVQVEMNKWNMPYTLYRVHCSAISGRRSEQIFDVILSVLFCSVCK